jgi:hypothetical protein
VAQLGANAHGGVLEPGRVPDCYLGLRLGPAGGAEAAGVLVVAPAMLLHPAVPQPDGTLLHELLTGHPDRIPHELVFLADLTGELRAWPADTWSKAGVGPAGGRRGGGGRLAARRPAGPAAGRADRRGSPDAGATGPDPGPRPAWRPAWPSARPGVPAVAAPVQRTPGRRPVPVAVDTHRLRQGLRRIPIVQTPTFWTPTAVPETAADSQGVRGVRFCSHPGHRPRYPAGGRTAAGPQPPLRRHGRTAHVGLLVGAGQMARVDAASGERLSGCADTGRGLAEHREPARPRHYGHPRQRPRRLAKKLVQILRACFRGLVRSWRSPCSAVSPATTTTSAAWS